MRVRVKICGVTSVTDALLAVEAGADLIGLNFYPPSPRFVPEPLAREIRAVLSPTVWCVGVFVNAGREQVATLAEQLDLHALQFHGEETVAELQGWQRTVIKALRIRSDEPLPACEGWPANYFLLDSYSSDQYGGTGKPFAWERVATLPYKQRRRVILAGGLTPENVAAAVRTVRPWAVDVSSGVESAAGRKDAEKLRAFIAYAKSA